MTRDLKVRIYHDIMSGWFVEFWADGYSYGNHGVGYYATRDAALAAADTAASGLLTSLNRDIGFAPPFSYVGEEVA